MATLRIYVVSDSAANKKYLVRAQSPASAIRAIVTPQFSAELADQDALIDLVSAGIKVVEAKDGDAP